MLVRSTRSYLIRQVVIRVVRLLVIAHQDLQAGAYTTPLSVIEIALHLTYSLAPTHVCEVGIAPSSDYLGLQMLAHVYTAWQTRSILSLHRFSSLVILLLPCHTVTASIML